MNETSSNNFWLFLELLAKKRNFIFGFVILCIVAAVIVSLILPKWYTADTIIMPPKTVDIPVGDLGRISEAVSVTSGLNLPVLVTPSDIYVQMLKSRSVTDRIIEEFDLADRYDAGNYDETYEALMKHSSFMVSNEGMLVISVEDKSPQTAADMANAFASGLENLNKDMVDKRIKQTLEFVVDRLEEVKIERDSARQALENFQLAYKTVDFDEQTRLAVEQAVHLRINLSEVDFKIQVNELNMSKDNANLIKLKNEKSIIEKQLAQLENSNADSSFFSLPVSMIPTLKGKYELLYSRVKVAEALYELLLQQREQFKMKELQNMPTITVLDQARVPELRSRPKRTYIVLGTFVLSLIAAILLAMISEYLKGMEKKNPSDYNRASAFLGAYFGWLPGGKKHK